MGSLSAQASRGTGYSGTPLWRKLGYRDGLAVLADHAPDHYLPLLALPADIRVTWLARAVPGMPFVHVFAIRASRLQAALRSYRKTIAPDGVIWASWPKKSSGVPTDITEDVIREVALPTGLVDVKVCAVDRCGRA